LVARLVRDFRFEADASVLIEVITVAYFAGGKARLTAEIRQRTQRIRREKISCILFLFPAVFCG
jgi:hypothetical protein